MDAETNENLIELLPAVEQGPLLTPYQEGSNSGVEIIDRLVGQFH